MKKTLLTISIILSLWSAHAEIISGTVGLTDLTDFGIHTTSQSSAPANEVPNLLASASDGVAQGAHYIYNAAKGLDFSQGAEVSVAGLKRGDLWGGGISVMTTLTNNPIQAGLGIYEMQERDPATGQKSWSLYTVSLQLAVSQRETVPLLNIPVDVIVGTGAGLKISKYGNEVIEHSEFLVRYSCQLRKNCDLALFAGIIHESEFPHDVFQAAGAALRFGF